MGQAIADLPNSSDKPAEPIGNADDLLSQLAGEEIDRLLAEADAHPVAPPEPAMPAPPTDIESLPAADPADPVIKEMPAEVTVGGLDQELAAAAEKTPAPDPFDAQVNELFNELKDLPEEKPPAPAAADIPPHASIPTDVINASALASPIEQATTAAERAALDQPARAMAQPEVAVNVRPSMLVRILEIANAPVNSLPDSLRDALGKVAILTLMNAVGVLLYLALFRK